MKKLHIDVWSDIACPWCYIGKRRLEAALAAFPHRDSVQVRWRAFELDPDAAPVSDPRDYAERLAQKYRTSVGHAATMVRHMRDAAAGDGLDFHFERIRPGNTFDAHRVLHLASERGIGELAQERFLHAYMTEGAPIGEPETLVRLAAEVGLDVDEVRALLASDAHARAVRHDEAEAEAYGISGVPFFVFAERYGVSGAHSAGALLEVLLTAWADLEEEPEVIYDASADAEAGAACGPDGCN